MALTPEFAEVVKNSVIVSVMITVTAGIVIKMKPWFCKTCKVKHRKNPVCFFDDPKKYFEWVRSGK